MQRTVWGLMMATCVAGLCGDGADAGGKWWKRGGNCATPYASCAMPDCGCGAPMTCAMPYGCSVPYGCAGSARIDYAPRPYFPNYYPSQGCFAPRCSAPGCFGPTGPMLMDMSCSTPACSAPIMSGCGTPWGCSQPMMVHGCAGPMLGHGFHHGQGFLGGPAHFHQAQMAPIPAMPAAEDIAW